jgi:hypothetical protein
MHSILRMVQDTVSTNSPHALNESSSYKVVKSLKFKIFTKDKNSLATNLPSESASFLEKRKLKGRIAPLTEM